MSHVGYKGLFADYSPRQLSFLRGLPAPWLSWTQGPLWWPWQGTTSPGFCFILLFSCGWGKKKGIILLILPKAILFSHKCRVSFPPSHSSAPRPERLLSPECLPPPSASASCPPLALFELSLLPVFPTLTQLIWANIFLVLWVKIWLA